jgi:WD40 repeat protein
MSIIRLWRAEGSSDFASEVIEEAGWRGSAVGAAFSPTGSFAAASFSRAQGSALTLHDLESMTMAQSVVIPGFNAACVAVSRDSKQLVHGGKNVRIRLLQTDDFSIQKDLDTKMEAMSLSSVAFDPACRVLAFGCDNGRLELRSL